VRGVPGPSARDPETAEHLFREGLEAMKRRAATADHATTAETAKGKSIRPLSNWRPGKRCLTMTQAKAVPQSEWTTTVMSAIERVRQKADSTSGWLKALTTAPRPSAKAPEMSAAIGAKTRIVT
jgi:hypothetical protein